MEGAAARERERERERRLQGPTLWRCGPCYEGPTLRVEAVVARVVAGARRKVVVALRLVDRWQWVVSGASWPR